MALCVIIQPLRISGEKMTSSILSEFSWPLVAICTVNTRPNPGQKSVRRKTSQEDCWLVPRRLPVFFSDHHLAYWFESSNIHSDQGYQWFPEMIIFCNLIISTRFDRKQKQPNRFRVVKQLYDMLHISWQLIRQNVPFFKEMCSSIISTYASKKK